MIRLCQAGRSSVLIPSASRAVAHCRRPVEGRLAAATPIGAVVGVPAGSTLTEIEARSQPNAFSVGMARCLRLADAPS
jgi:hypothetical protein